MRVCLPCSWARTRWAAAQNQRHYVEVVTGVFVDRALEAEKSQREYQAPWPIVYKALACCKRRCDETPVFVFEVQAVQGGGAQGASGLVVPCFAHFAGGGRIRA